MNLLFARRCYWCLTAVAAGAFAVIASAAGAQNGTADRAPQPLELTLRDDAALSSVCFVSATEGWAAGDRGVVWHTRDAGATWEQQNAHANCALNGVFFLDATRGWAVGGASKPFARATSGVVLQTTDGGKTWTSSRGAELLPVVSGVRFFSGQQGVAFGAPSAMYASGVYQTRDGGLSWQPVACDAGGDWQAGDFLDAAGGALAGAGGRFATCIRSEVKQSPLSAGSLRTLHAMRLAAPTGGWVVGDGGLVATTNDLGRSWQMPEGELPNRASEQFDFYAVAMSGPHVWIAGSPGTRVFHSADGGKTWESNPTGQRAPLRAMSFADPEHGWAVGELGTILATQDGGRTWRTQRCGGQHAALLSVFGRAGDVPLEVITHEGAAEGYLAAVNILFRSPPVESAAANERDGDNRRTREAMLLSGATAAETAWQFPLAPNDLALDSAAMLEALNRANDGRAAERLVGMLVRQVRMWRPDVIVTADGAKAADSMDAFVQQLVLRAVEAAADPAQFVELSTGAGLEAWQVKRVYGVLPPGTRGQETITTGQFSPQLCVALADWAAPARRLLSATRSSPPDIFELALRMDRVDGGPTSGRGLFRGLALASGGDARRRVAALPAGDVDQMRRLAARRRNLEELLERKAGDAAWAAQVVQLTDGLPATGGGELVYQLADGYRASGRLDLAADTYYLLARRYPDHPLSEQALRWLVQYYASNEAATRMGSSSGATGSASAIQGKNVRRTDGNATGEGTGEAGGTHVQQASATAPIRGETPPAVGLSRDERLRRAVELGKYLEAARPMLFSEPGVRFPLVAAERQLGFANSSKRYFLSLRPLPESDPWRRCAMTEEWLAEPRDVPPAKVLGRCRRATERPHLDGQLDEPYWQGNEVLRLVARGGPPVGPVSAKAGETPAATVSTEVRLAYDAEFLYIAVRSPKATGGDYAADDRPRAHDADLAAHDRVAIRLDTDRDYGSYFELVVDHRGWTRDTCVGDASWNPTWYVAAAADDTSWTVEAAVPLKELVEKSPDARAVWAAGVRRTIPRVGYETWAGDAESNDSPDQYGLLIFD